jgi:hypothetical protein
MALRLLSLVPKIPVKAAVLIQSMPLLLVIKPVRSIEVKGNQLLKEEHQMLERKNN